MKVVCVICEQEGHSRPTIQGDPKDPETSHGYCKYHLVKHLRRELGLDYTPRKIKIKWKRKIK